MRVAQRGSAVGAAREPAIPRVSGIHSVDTPSSRRELGENSLPRQRAACAPCAVLVAGNRGAVAPCLAWAHLYLAMAEASLPPAIFAWGMPIELSGLFWGLERQSCVVKGWNQTMFCRVSLQTCSIRDIIKGRHSKFASSPPPTSRRGGEGIQTETGVDILRKGPPVEAK